MSDELGALVVRRILTVTDVRLTCTASQTQRIRDRPTTTG